jgi:hypothetical protein
LYAFFDAKVPEGISTGAAFERWRRVAEASDPKVLWLTEKDITATDAALDALRFPDHLSAGPLVVQLRYRFEPGHEDDGVSCARAAARAEPASRRAVRVAGSGPARRQDHRVDPLTAEAVTRALRAGA